ncbi:MAG TPA: glycoside hydrolase family 38 C-terminal domain-containing protein, partial [Candidatus Hydrogenedentes bacterium]|nr:glycoside hydrolase family 38 C-terminal domain-containing protein [Candidatus Hydrogenedentota bacterium]
PDGSRLVYYKLMDKGSYGPFDFLVRTPIKKAGYTDASFKEHFEPYFAEEQARGAAPVVLMLDAIDHQRPDPEMPGLLEELQHRYPEIAFVWGSLEQFAAELQKYRDEYPEWKGELREPARDHKRVGQYLIVHTLSSRIDLKKRNDLCTVLLEKWCEPYALFARMHGSVPVLNYLEKAWEYLLKNHPHDSICGCSIDQVHRDMHYRFDQAEMIGTGLLRRCLAFIGSASSDHEAWQRLAVHNPLPFARTGVFDMALYFPSDYGVKTGHTFHDGLATGEEYNKFHLVDALGNRVPYQHRSIERGIECRILTSSGREAIVPGDCYHVAVEMELPPCGLTGLSIEGTDDATRTFGSLLCGPMSASNGLITVSVDNSGAVSLAQKEGPSFEGLFLYEDSGDCGDGWTRGIPVNDTVFRSYGSSVITGIEENGPLRTTFRIERQFSLPRALDPKTKTRSMDRVTVTVTDLVSLEKHCGAVLVKTIIENTAEDHRLRVIFPTRRDAEHSFADTPFAIVEREIQIPEHTAIWQERINEEKPFTSFCGCADSQGGLAVVSPAGLHEYAVLPTAARELAVTLLRAFGKTVGKPREKDGQLKGSLCLEYAIVPFSGTPQPRTLLNLASRLQTPVRVHATAERPTPKSFLSVRHGKAVITAIKPSTDGKGGIVRFWNPTSEAIEDEFVIARPVTSAYYCNLNEEPGEAIEYAGASIPVRLAPGGLGTISFTWQD